MAIKERKGETGRGQERSQGELGRGAGADGAGSSAAPGQAEGAGVGPSTGGRRRASRQEREPAQLAGDREGAAVPGEEAP